MTTADAEEARGRRRSRNVDAPGEAAPGASPDAEADPDVDGDGRSRKRRRSRKGLDKKFDCPYPDCGKSYSRAEHLYRHQLNREHLFSIASRGWYGLILI